MKWKAFAAFTLVFLIFAIVLKYWWIILGGFAGYYLYHRIFVEQFGNSEFFLIFASSMKTCIHTIYGKQWQGIASDNLFVPMQTLEDTCIYYKMKASSVTRKGLLTLWGDWESNKSHKLGYVGSTPTPATKTNNMTIQNKLYVVTRNDLKAGEQIAQVSHSTSEFAYQLRKDFVKWYNESKYIVVLAVKDLKELEELARSLQDKGLNVVKNFEPDLDNQLTAFCITPEDFLVAKKLVQKIPLAFK